MEYKRDEHRVHLIIYHLVWTSKRRKKVLVNDIKIRCNELIKDKCEEHGWEIVELTIQPDHIHLFIRVWPKDSAADVIKEVKGYTSNKLRKEFPELMKMPSMWTRSYFASTAGNVSGETIRKYIEAQKGL